MHFKLMRMLWNGKEYVRKHYVLVPRESIGRCFAVTDINEKVIEGLVEVKIDKKSTEVYEISMDELLLKLNEK